MQPQPDWSGYNVETQGGGDVALTYRVVRDSDGVGVGAYVTPEEVTAAIEADRAAIAAAATG